MDGRSRELHRGYLGRYWWLPWGGIGTRANRNWLLHHEPPLLGAWPSTLGGMTIRSWGHDHPLLGAWPSTLGGMTIRSWGHDHPLLGAWPPALGGMTTRSWGHDHPLLGAWPSALGGMTFHSWGHDHPLLGAWPSTLGGMTTRSWGHDHPLLGAWPPKLTASFNRNAVEVPNQDPICNKIRWTLQPFYIFQRTLSSDSAPKAASVIERSRVPGCITRVPGIESRCYHIFWVAVGQERDPLGLVRIIEESLKWKSAPPVQKTEFDGFGIRRADHVISL
jgi:hypothetical protein